MPRNAVDLIHAFNAGRDPQRLALKYRAMAADPFAFLRGSCHLFYQDYAIDGVAEATPAVWICGDLHLENFGSYLGENHHAYFDLNDFGEALLAPASWELSRFLVSVLVAAQSLSIKPAEALKLCGFFLSAYAEKLAIGSADKVNDESAKGMVRDLLRSVRERSSAEFLEERTDSRNAERTLRLDGKKALPIDATEREKIERLIARHAATQPNPMFFNLIDIARRIAGTGSLGIERYVLLVRGPGGKDAPRLLDLRHEPGSALAPYVSLKQPNWPNEATRVVEIQRNMQANTPAFLSALNLGERSYVLRELLPSQDRLALKDWNGKLGRLENVMRTMGWVLAWAQIRSSDHLGSTSVSELQKFGIAMPGLFSPLLEHALSCSQRLIQDWRAFSQAHTAIEK